MRICPECLARSEVDRCERDGTGTLELADPSLGQSIAERYLLLAEIGRGGTSVVYRAFQRGTRRQVALKILTGEDDPEFAARFRREAEITASLESPHTVTVYDFGETEDGGLYLAMELVEGRSLEDLIEAGGPIAIERARRWLGQIVASLEEAHRRGLVHRDLKPSNVIVGSSDVVTVLDFGLARALAEEQRRLTQPGSFFGTPPYMAPEMWSEDPRSTGIATDIYALGVMTFEMVTGKLPFDASSLQAFMHAHLEKRAPEIGSVNRSLAGTSWERAIARCLEKRPEDRFPSATAFLEALDARPSQRRGPIAAIVLVAALLAAALPLLLSSRARPIRLLAPEIVGPLPEQARAAALAAVEPALRECHARAPLAEPSRLHLVVVRDGSASSRIQPAHPELNDCLRPTVDALGLPPLAGGRVATITIPIDFADDP